MKLEHTEIMFLTWLELASFKAVQFGQKYVRQKLAAMFQFELHLNMANDDLAEGDFYLYPEDNGRVVQYSTLREGATELVRRNHIPVWIDISAYGHAKEHTLPRLFCAGCFTDNTDQLYYFRQGIGCFGVKSPDLPPGYRNGSRFKLKTV